MTTKTNTYWELVRYYRDESGTLRSEPLGLYCSKERANMERAIYKDTDLHMVADEETVSLTVRKFKETIEEVEMLDMDEIEMLGAIYG
tara:strand:+ start:374 stop:637 length:264 start_codon:yes stop_codon:yes gene_type:complete